MSITKDTRLSFNYQRIEHEGNVWHIDAKLDPTTNKLKVYRVYGDITNQTLVNEAINLWLQSQLLKVA